MRAAAESSNALVTQASRRPFPLMNPPISSVPGDAGIGTDSPVSIDVLTLDSPSVTTQSTGTFSPARISMTSPTESTAGSTTLVAAPSLILAVSGVMSISSEMDFLARPTARHWRNSPSSKSSATETASTRSPMANAPRVAITTSAFSLMKSLPSKPCQALRRTGNAAAR